MNRLPYSLCKPVYDDVGWKPTGPEQDEIVRNRDRFPQISGGERAGKSELLAIIMLAHIVLLPSVRPEDFFNEDGTKKFGPGSKTPSPHFILVGATYREPKVEFQYVLKYLRALNLVSEKHLSMPKEGRQTLVTTFGVCLQTWSLDDPSSIRAIELDGAGVCEAGTCPYDGVQRLQGRISSRRGFIIYSGTMERAESWWTDHLLIGKRPNLMGVKSYVLPSWTNRFMYPGGRNDPEILRLEHSGIYDADTFAMRVAAEPRPLRERVLRNWQEDLIQEIEPPDTADWEIWTDPGFAAANAVLLVAIWETEPGTEFFYVYDELYLQGYHAREVVAEARKWEQFGWVRRGYMDIAGKGHRDGTDSALEVWKKLTRIQFSMKLWGEGDSIERLRASASLKQFAISPRCKGLIAEAGLGRPVFPEMHPWKYPVDAEGYARSEKPLDRWNHSAKALAYGLLGHLGRVEVQRKYTSYSRMRRGGKRVPTH